MKIQSQNQSNTNFKSIIIFDNDARTRILNSLDKKGIVNLKNILIKQQSNPVNAFIGIDKNKLTASLHCEYRLKDFKENYRQIPFFESNFNFVKRIAKKCDEYKSQLVDFCNV